MNEQFLLQRLLASQSNVRCGDLEAVARAFGFELTRTRGSHRMHAHPMLAEQLNL